MNAQIQGLVFGVAFGFLLQKGRVARYDKQIGVMRLSDMTVVKFMLSGVLVAMTGVYLLLDLGKGELHFLPTILGADIAGGLIYGVGWGLIGYCPGTSFAALGEGRWDALFGISGMIFGAGIFAEVYPFFKTTVMSWGDFGYITLPALFGVNHWSVIVMFTAVGLGVLRWIESKGL